MAQVRALEERFADFFAKRFIEKRIEVEQSIERGRRHVFPWGYFIAAYNPRVIRLIDGQYAQSGSHPLIRVELLHALVTESLKADARWGPKKAQTRAVEVLRKLDAEVGQIRAIALKEAIDFCLSSLEKPMTQKNVMSLRNVLSSVQGVLQSMGVIPQEAPKDTRGAAE
jgi:hypothetical protein